MGKERCINVANDFQQNVFPKNINQAYLLLFISPAPTKDAGGRDSIPLKTQKFLGSCHFPYGKFIVGSSPNQMAIPQLNFFQDISFPTP